MAGCETDEGVWLTLYIRGDNIGGGTGEGFVIGVDELLHRIDVQWSKVGRICYLVERVRDVLDVRSMRAMIMTLRFRAKSCSALI